MAPTMMAQEPSNSNSLNHNVNVNNKAKEIGLAVTVEGIKVGPGGKMKQVSADGALSKNSSSSFSFGKDSNASVPAAPAPPSASEPTPPTAPTSASATLVPVQSPTSGTTTTLLIPPETAVRVIKGEIHNVLGQFRADQRYVSSARFTEEILGYHLDNTSSAGTSSAKDQHHQQQNHHQHQQQHHPVVQHFQDLHAALSEWEPQQHPNGQQQNGQQQNALDPMMYLPAFCAAVTGREISAPVTGAALSALHKFLLYGFLVPGSFHAVEGMSAIADALLNCTFEEDEKPAQVSPQRRTMNIQAGMMQGQVSNSVVPPGAGNSVLNMSGGAAANNSGGANNNIGNVRHLTATSSSSNSHSAFNVQHNDEQVVLKLLDLSALVVRCSLQGVNLIPARSVVGLLDTCLHVSHRASRASPLLKSAAVDALSQIVLQVFAGTGVPVMQARKEILRQLSALLNPAAHDESVTVSSLTAVNIALETCREPLQPDEIEIVQNDLCKYLLQWSTTGSQVILSLTLRVIFNLFSSIRNHLKVPLEVFLTSVHLRLCDTSSMSAVPPEHAEVALESLLEFCQEPALMQDLYLNYDCDVACTNLYETVVAALGKTAIPNGWDQALQESAASAAAAAASSSHGKNNTNGTANALVPSSAATTAGAGTATALVNKNSKTTSIKTTNGSNTPSAAASAIVVAGDNGQQALHPTAAANAPVNALQRLAAEGLLAILDSIAQRCQATSTAASSTTPPFSSRTSSMNESDTASNGELQQGLDWQSQESDLEVLHERKQKKHSLSKVAEAFNAEPMKKEWRALAASLDLLSNIDDPKQISHVLYTAPELDKVELGLYLSKGPEDKYPLEASVRTRFLEHFDFSNLTFAAALRKFLSKFRLPGEAQCIDRLMEAFSKELFQQQGESTFFKNADAVYVLAFSTIMLNTDLHNPTIKQEARMTLDQFIRNNRGINGGEDLPADYLTTLYEQIKDVQIQVRRELGEFMKKNEHGDIRATWEAVLSKSGEVATPFFTPASRARRNMSRAGVHDKEMFIVLSKWALKSLPGIFMRSWDDALVVKTLRGMKQMAKIAVFFDLDYIVDEILQVLLPRGRDYVINCVTWDHANNVDGGASVVSSANRTVQSIESMDDDERDLLDSDQPIPYDLLCTNESDNHDIDIAGSASNRGLLALDCSFVLLRKYAARATDAWPCFIECLCALRDARALPIGLSDLDDFADSNGNVLPLSSFAKKSQRRLDEHYRALSDQDADKKKSWFRSFFNKKEAKAREEDESLNGDDGSVAPNKGDISRYARILLAIAEAADVENVVQMGSTKLPAAEKTIISLLDTVDQYPFKKDPVQEQRAIFSLELAARALLSNRDRAPELFILFLNKFESILGRVTDKKVPSPFVIERIVVTILRCSIHLYDLPDVSFVIVATCCQRCVLCVCSPLALARTCRDTSHPHIHCLFLC
jgi:brefeldin A-resistance guanine nucleotide exchange factor 1